LGHNSKESDFMKIAIIGSGWAGLSCAEQLCEYKSYDLTIFEMSPLAGGRARGLSWKLKDDRILKIDNGQHLVIGAYDKFLRLLKTCKSPEWQVQDFKWTTVELSKKTFSKKNTFFVKKNERLAPFDLLSLSLIQGIPFSWKLQLGYIILLSKFKKPVNDEGARKWLEKNFQTSRIIQFFWKPFIESTLNTEIENASTIVFLNVLMECFKNIPNSIQIFHPKNNFAIDAIDPVLSYLSSKGVKINLNTRVSKITNNFELLTKTGFTDPFDIIILALPNHSANRIWKSSNFPKTDESNNWRTKEYRQIYNLWVALPKGFGCKIPVDKLNWEIVCRLDPDYDDFYVVLDRPDESNGKVISIVKSAIVSDITAEEIIKETSAIKDFTDKYLKHRFNLNLIDCEYKLVKERKATFACLAGLDNKKTLHQKIKTGVTGIFKCSDEGINNLPATIESAVRSGIAVAQKVKAIKPENFSSIV